MAKPASGSPVSDESKTGRKTPGSGLKGTGRSGTVNTRGFIQDREFNQKLRWPLNLDEYDKMRRSDPTVKWMLALLSTPIRAALWSIEPPDDPTPEEMEATCFARKAIFEEMDGGWDEHLRQALTYFDFGHAVFERVADLRTIEFDVEPLEEDQEPFHVKRDAFVLARLGPRLQRTIQRWNVDPNEPNRLTSIVQWLADGHEPSITEIDADRLVVYVNEKEGDDWRGISILRSAWFSYFTKIELQNMEAIAMQRSAGVPVGYPPADAGDEQLDALEQSLKKVAQGEQVYIVMPGPKQLPARGAGGQQPEWLVENLAVDASAGVDYGAAIQRYDTEMARNVMASFMQLGMQEVGARATADVQQDPYYQAIEAQVGYIEDVFSEAVLRPLIDWNYSLDRYPRLSASKIQAKNVQVVAQAIAELVNAGAVQPDEPLQVYLRELLDAPDMDPDYEEEQPNTPEELEGPRATEASGRGDPSKQDAGGTQGQGEPGTGGAPGMAMSRRVGRRLRRRLRRRAGRREAFSQFVPPRPLVGPEQHVAWQQIQDTLDNAELDIIAIAERVMGGQIDAVTSLADEAVEQINVEAIEGLSLDSKPLAEALETELLRIYATGQADVRAEVRRQVAAAKAAGEPPQPGEAMKQEGEPPDVPVSKTETAAIIAALAANLADTGSQAAVKAVKQRALKTLAQRSKTEVQPGEDPLAEMRAALRLSGPQAATRIYGMGRMDEIRSQHYAGWIEVVQRSAVLDANTCDPCEASDGETFRPEVAPVLPDPDCQGGDRCRCVYIPDIAPPGSTDLP